MRVIGKKGIILVTGGVDFIGDKLIQKMVMKEAVEVPNLDDLRYVGIDIMCDKLHAV